MAPVLGGVVSSGELAVVLLAVAVTFTTLWVY